jgi:predicted RNA binding protein YcfA (HicA-like mRNA interferase family)
MAKDLLDTVISDLKNRQKSLRCAELKKHLESLGFDVRKGSSGNHFTFTHPKIRTFFGSNYDCGHGRNPEVLPVYIKKAIKTLETYESELRSESES